MPDWKPRPRVMQPASHLPAEIDVESTCAILLAKSVFRQSTPTMYTR